MAWLGAGGRRPPLGDTPSRPVAFAEAGAPPLSTTSFRTTCLGEFVGASNLPPKLRHVVHALVGVEASGAAGCLWGTAGRSLSGWRRVLQLQSRGGHSGFASRPCLATASASPSTAVFAGRAAVDAGALCACVGRAS